MLAIAPYFGSYNASRDTSVDVLLNKSMSAGVDAALALVVQHAAYAQKYGKPLITYEAGQGLVGDVAMLQQVSCWAAAGRAGCQGLGSATVKDALCCSTYQQCGIPWIHMYE